MEIPLPYVVEIIRRSGFGYGLGRWAYQNEHENGNATHIVRARQRTTSGGRKENVRETENPVFEYLSHRYQISDITSDAFILYDPK